MAPPRKPRSSSARSTRRRASRSPSYKDEGLEIHADDSPSRADNFSPRRRSNTDASGHAMTLAIQQRRILEDPWPETTQSGQINPEWASVMGIDSLNGSIILTMKPRPQIFMVGLIRIGSHVLPTLDI